MNRDYFSSLRFKLIVAFFALGVAISSALGYAAHDILADKLFQELRNTVGNIGLLGSDLLDKQAIERLAALNSGQQSDEQVEAVETSDDFKNISATLNKIRDIKKNLVRYVYLVTPTDDENTVRYLVDADVLALKAEGAEDAEISHFNSAMDISGFPDFKAALAEKKPLVEETYVFDEDFGINSVSGYAPVMSADGSRLLALLGLDMSDRDVQAALHEVTVKSVLLSLVSLLISLVVAILVGAYLTRSIITLDQLVQRFTEKDFSVRAEIKSNDEVGRLGRSFNSMAETIQKYSAHLEALVNAYGRFVPHDLIRMMDKESILDVHLGDQTQKEMAVLFSDIRNFTSISEAMTPKQNFDFINSYLSRVGPRIRAHEGIIDKYIGDAVMALFPKSSEHAIKCAIDMQLMVQQYNNTRNLAYPAIKIGVGIHSGKVMLGTIGEDERMDGTIISDAVNLASRVEGLTKKYDALILVSDSLLAQLPDPDKFKHRLVDKVYVVGKSTPTRLYEIYETDEPQVIALKDKTLASYNKAVDLFYARDFVLAQASFAEVLSVNPADVPARQFSDKCAKFIAEGYPADWDGTTRAESK